MTQETPEQAWTRGCYATRLLISLAMLKIASNDIDTLLAEHIEEFPLPPYLKTAELVEIMDDIKEKDYS